MRCTWNQGSDDDQVMAEAYRVIQAAKGLGKRTVVEEGILPALAITELRSADIKTLRFRLMDRNEGKVSSEQMERFVRELEFSTEAHIIERHGEVTVSLETSIDEPGLAAKLSRVVGDWHFLEMSRGKLDTALSNPPGDVDKAFLLAEKERTERRADQGKQ